MEKKIITQELALLFDKSEQDYAESVAQACKKSANFIHEYLGIDIPKDIRIYIMTSWVSFYLT